MAPLGRSGPSSRSRRQFGLVFVVFLFLLGQPVVVFALALLSPGLPSLVVITLGTAALSASVARLFFRQGGSVDRLANFVLVLAGVQVLLALLGHLAMAAADLSVSLSAARPLLVFVGYPVAYYLVYRGPPVLPGSGS